MTHQIQNLNEIPRVAFHNVNHLLRETKFSPLDFFEKTLGELNTYLPKNLTFHFTYLLDSSMYTDDSKESIPLGYQNPLHPFANIPLRGFNLKSNSFFRRVLNHIPLEPTLVFFKGHGPFRIFSLHFMNSVEI